MNIICNFSIFFFKIFFVNYHFISLFNANWHQKGLKPDTIKVQLHLKFHQFKIGQLTISRVPIAHRINKPVVPQRIDEIGPRSYRPRNAKQRQKQIPHDQRQPQVELGPWLHEELPAEDQNYIQQRNRVAGEKPSGLDLLKPAGPAMHKVLWLEAVLKVEHVRVDVLGVGVRTLVYVNVVADWFELEHCICMRCHEKVNYLKNS